MLHFFAAYLQESNLTVLCHLQGFCFRTLAISSIKTGF